jgi:hypothetical protein
MSRGINTFGGAQRAEKAKSADGVNSRATGRNKICIGGKTLRGYALQYPTVLTPGKQLQSPADVFLSCSHLS